MKLRIMSDLHTEFHDYKVVPMPDDKETVLVLAGDIGCIHHSSSSAALRSFIIDCSNRFRHVIWVMGNHEHYHGSLLLTQHKIRDMLVACELHNVSLLENENVVIDDVTFVGATLWTDCFNNDPFAEFEFKHMNDSRHIRFGNTDDPYKFRLTALETMREHDRSRMCLSSDIRKAKQQGLKTVVVTHHAISEMSRDDEFKFSSNNMFFYSHLHDYFAEEEPDLMIHGHMHTAKDYYLDDNKVTRVICNPRGYPTQETGFDEKLTVEI